MGRATGLSAPLLVCISALGFAGLANAAGIGDQYAKRNTQRIYENLPLAFEENHGQTDSQVKFLTRGNRYTLFLTSTDAVLRLQPSGAPVETRGDGSETGAVLRIRLAGANPNPVISGRNLLPGVSNYLKDLRPWHTNIPNYAAVEYKNVLPGIHLRYYGNRRQLEYDVVIAPHARSSALLFQFEGAERLRLDERGDLIIKTAAGEIRQSRPYAYQLQGGSKKQVAAAYALQDRDHVRIQVGDYDTSRELIIDPVLRYSTYLGGATAEDDGNTVPAQTNASDIFVDGTGHAYVAGDTDAIDFPTTAGAFRRTADRSCVLSEPDLNCFSDDSFITKLNPTGTALVYSTYIIGKNLPSLHGLAVDANGNAFIAGKIEDGRTSDKTAVIMKLSADGSTLLYQFFLGFLGETSTVATDIAVDAAGMAYVTGFTTDDTMPTTPGAFDRGFNGNFDAFVLKLDSSKEGNASIVYSTYLGGNNDDVGRAITVDGGGNAYVTGTSFSSNFPTTSSFGTPAGRMFVTRLNATGTGLVYSTRISGASPQDIALDPSRNAYVTGTASSTGFPRTSGAFRTTFAGGSSDAFVLKLSSGGRNLLYSTFLGGSNLDEGISIAVDSSGRAYVAGTTTSTNFPVTSNASQKTRIGTTDAFVTVLNPSGNGLSFYSTYLGGSSGQTFAGGIAIDRALNAYVTGSTSSPNFRTTSGAFQRALQGSESAFVTKIVIAADLALTKTASSSTVNRGSNLTYTLKVLNKGPDRSDSLLLTDTMPSGTTFVRFTTSAGSCTAPAVGSRGTLNCKRTNLSKDSTWTVTMTVRVNASRGSTVTNTAKVTAKTQDLTGGNNSASASTRVN